MDLITLSILSSLGLPVLYGLFKVAQKIHHFFTPIEERWFNEDKKFLSDASLHNGIGNPKEVKRSLLQLKKDFINLVPWKEKFEEQNRYAKKKYVPLNESTLRDFVLEREGLNLEYIFYQQEISDVSLDSKIENWDMFPMFSEMRPFLRTNFEMPISERHDYGKYLKRKVEYEKQKEEVVAIVRMMCEVVNNDYVEQETEVKTALVEPADSSPIKYTSERFDRLTEKVSNVSHLKTSYIELGTMLNQRDDLFPESRERIEQTLKEIEDQISLQKEKDLQDKAWRDSRHIQHVRASIGLAETGLNIVNNRKYVEKETRG